MPMAARIGDPISHGGAIVEGSLDVFTESLPQARVADAAVCDEHGDVTISQGSFDTFVNSRLAARVGDSVSCGATISSGAVTTMING